MDFFVEIGMIPLDAYFSNAIGTQILDGETTLLECFDFNNIPVNVARFRTYYLKNDKPVYSGWIYNGKKISVDDLRKTLIEIKTQKDLKSTEIFTRKKESLANSVFFDSQMAFLETTKTRLGLLVKHIEETIKYMETYNLSYACDINSSSFYPMFADELVLSEYLEMKKDQKIREESKSILGLQNESKENLVKLIALFKSLNRPYFSYIDENGDWDLSKLDNAPKEEIYKLFMTCVHLFCEARKELSLQVQSNAQTRHLFSLLGLEELEDSHSEGRKLQYTNPEENE